MPTLDEYLRTFHRGPDRGAARAHDAEQVARAEEATIEAYLRTLAPFTRPTEGLALGTTVGGGQASALVRLPWRVARGLSSWVVGGTGTGKTRALLAWSAQDLADEAARCLFLDCKGEYAGALADVVIPKVAMGLPPEKGARLLAGLRVLAPWVNERLPSLHLTARGGDTARRATILTDIFNAAVGVGELGHRQAAVFGPALRLCMEAGVPFPLLPDVLRRPAFRSALLLASDDEELKAFFSSRFEVEARDTIVGGILSRIDRFLADEAARLALFAHEPFDPAEWIESGTTVVNLDGALRPHRIFWSGLVVHALVESILRRQTTRGSPRVVVRIDEAQLALPTAEQALALENALSLMRSRRACLTLAHQHAGQLAHYPALVQGLRTNVGMCAVFRCAEEGLGAVGHALPDALPLGVDGSGLSEAQVRDAWMRALTALPDRTFLLRVPALAPGSIAVRTLDFDIETLAHGVPADIRALGHEGQGGYTRAELAGRERQWRRTVEEISATLEPNPQALMDLGEAPADRRPRRRIVEAG